MLTAQILHKLQLIVCGDFRGRFVVDLEVLVLVLCEFFVDPLAEDAIVNDEVLADCGRIRSGFGLALVGFVFIRFLLDLLHRPKSLDIQWS